MYFCFGFFIQVMKLDWYFLIMFYLIDVVLIIVFFIFVIVDIMGNCFVCVIIKQNLVMRYVEFVMYVINNDILFVLNKGVKVNNNYYINKLFLRRFFI